MSSEYEVISRTSSLGRGPLTQKKLVAELNDLGLANVSSQQLPLIVHSSLSRLGWVCGGARTVCEALFEVMGPNGNLIMPAQSTEYSDPSLWTTPPIPEEWWPVVRNELPVFDPLLNTSRNMGAVAELFRIWPGTRRSNHPSISFCAFGPQAEQILFPHPLSPGFGEGSPLDRLYQLDAWILLLGTEYDACTALHLAEARQARPNWLEQGVPAFDSAGQRVWQKYLEIQYDSDLFLWIGNDYELRQKPKDFYLANIGCATSRLMRMRPLVDFAITWLNQKSEEKP